MLQNNTRFYCFYCKNRKCTFIFSAYWIFFHAPTLKNLCKWNKMARLQSRQKWWRDHLAHFEGEWLFVLSRNGRINNRFRRWKWRQKPQRWKWGQDSEHYGFLIHLARFWRGKNRWEWQKRPLKTLWFWPRFRHFAQSVFEIQKTRCNRWSRCAQKRKVYQWELKQAILSKIQRHCPSSIGIPIG